MLSALFEGRSKVVDLGHPSQIGRVDESTGLWSWFGGRTRTGATVDETSAMRVTALFCAVKIISETVAQLPLTLLRDRGPAGRETARTHPLWRVLHSRANPEQTAYDFRELVTGWAALRGNGYAEIESDGAGRVVALWPLPPTRVRPQRNDNRKLVYEVTLPDGKTVILPAGRMLHLRGFSTGGLMGLSLVEHFREAIGLALATEEYGASFFGNGSRPGGVLLHPGELKEKTRENLKRKWEEMHQGLENAHRVAILEEGMKWEQIGVNNDDAQFLQSREFQIGEFARILRIPPHMLADLRRATFSNIEQQALEFVQQTLMPWLVRFEQRFDLSLLTDAETAEGYYTKFRVQGLLRGDNASRQSFYHTLLQDGVISPDEVRELEDLNPQPDGIGKIYYRPLSLGQTGPGAPESPSDDLVGAEGSAGTPAKPIPVMLINQRRAILRAEKRNAARRRELAASFRDVFADKAAELIRRERRDVMEGIRSALQRRDRQDVQTFLDKYYSSHAAVVEKKMRAPVTSLMRSIHNAAADETGHSADFGERMQTFGAGYIRTLAERHAGASLGQLRQIAAETAPDEIEAALEKRFDEWEETRPEKIASRETVQGSNAAALMTFTIFAVAAVTWAASGETCPYCAAMDGRTISTGTNFFRSGDDFRPDGAEPLGFRTDIQHPPIHGGCDCQIVPS